MVRTPIISFAVEAGDKSHRRPWCWCRIVWDAGLAWIL